MAEAWQTNAPRPGSQARHPARGQRHSSPELRSSEPVTLLFLLPRSVGGAGHRGVGAGVGAIEKGEGGGEGESTVGAGSR